MQFEGMLGVLDHLRARGCVMKALQWWSARTNVKAEDLGIWILFGCCSGQSLDWNIVWKGGRHTELHRPYSTSSSNIKDMLNFILGDGSKSQLIVERE